MSDVLAPGLAELVVVFSHPDDEILFFFQAIRWLRPRRLRLLCATGDFGAMTAVRRRELAASARSLEGELTNLELTDRKGKGLDAGELASALAHVDKAGGVPVLTHGPLGEYGHRHHVDVFHSVHRRYGEDV